MKRAIQLPLLGGTETILVAEDDEVLRNLARDILEALGYKVLLAQDGNEVVRMYAERTRPIDMVLLDVVMPHMSGLEAYERICELGGNVPLLLMTGHSFEKVQSRFVKENEWAQVVIQKPYTVEGLGRIGCTRPDGANATGN